MPLSPEEMRQATPRTGPASAIALLRRHSLTSLVQQELERRILAGDILPGDKLNESDVAAELDVSRGPVREAFRALEQAGLVVTEKNRGVFVRQVSLQEADEIYEVRAGLDELIGRLAAERATGREIEELRGLIDEMRVAGKAKDVDAYYPLNVRFHDRLAQIAGNGTLLAAYRRLINELHLFRRRTLERGTDSFHTSTRQHAEIVEAVASRDGVRAGELLFQHAVKSRSRLHEALERDQSLPPPALVRETAP
jgi:phosphonate utilization transcriptional regulator